MSVAEVYVHVSGHGLFVRALCDTWPVFLLLTVSATDAAMIRVWKSSSLALPYHEREERPPEDFYPLGKLSQTERGC
jgi:hypothetical protein